MCCKEEIFTKICVLNSREEGCAEYKHDVEIESEAFIVIVREYTAKFKVLLPLSILKYDF